MHEPASLSTYAYLLLTASLFVVWSILYGVRPELRRQTLRISLGTMPLGLTEPLFVPAYWNPPTLLGLAHRTGFDLESLLFSFAIGGIVFAAYGALFRTTPAGSMAAELVSGVLFLGVYFVVFAAFNLAFPGYVAAVWNLAALSGVLLAGVPLEELMFAFTFGLYWSSVYEHLAWKRSRPVANASPVPARIGSAR